MKNLVISSVVAIIFYLHFNNAALTLADSEDGTSYWSNSSNSTNCSRVGSWCKSCYVSQVCQLTPNGSFVEYIDYCDYGMTCLNGSCTYQTNPRCNDTTTVEPEFECRTEGVFPDPYSCLKYYYCVPVNVTSPNGTVVHTSLVKYPAYCKCGYGYNPLTKVCDVDTGGICYYYPVGSCYEKGETSALWSNPTIYYICAENYNNSSGQLYPYLYQCEHGKKYNKLKYLCED